VNVNSNLLSLFVLGGNTSEREKKIGRPISVGDAWIAATALAYNAPLVTHNPDDFLNVPNLQRNNSPWTMTIEKVS
jgi:predicted nucleic acid-binding protein